MIKQLSIFSILLFVTLTPAFAQEIPSVDNTEVTGIQPDSPLWGLDVAIDKLRLAIAQTPVEKSRVGLEIAEERLVEINNMINLQKAVEAGEAQIEHELILNQTETEIEQIHEPNTETTVTSITEDLEEVIEIQERVEVHKIRVDEVKNKVKIILETNRDRLSENEHVEFERVRTGLDTAIERIEIEVEDEKTEIKIEFQDDFDKSSIDVDNQIRLLEDEFDDDVRIEFSNSGSGSFSSGSGSNSGSGSSNSGSGSSNSGSGSSNSGSDDS